jgi:hypothetical protein
MKVDMAPLQLALARYRSDNLPLPIWWRDDDAIAATPHLEKLADLSTELHMPVHLAVIPDRMDASLVPVVAGTDAFVPVAHGWRHDNHAQPDAKKSEFGQIRDAGATEISDGYARMRDQFGGAFHALFVPPWNRIDAGYYPSLTRAGFKALSTYGPRPAQEAAPGLLQINTHIDPIFWRGTRDLKDPDALIAEAVTMLEDRRIGRADHTEPFGYLTHHLVHTPQVWAFSRRFLQELLQGGATPQPLSDLIGPLDEQT